MGREVLLDALVSEARRHGWSGDYDNGWASWDIKLVGDRWHDITCYTASEELGWPHRFTRVRSEVKPTHFGTVAVTAAVIWTVASTIGGQWWAMILGAIVCVFILFKMMQSRGNCLKAITRLSVHAGRLTNLDAVVLDEGHAGASGTESESCSAEIESSHGYGPEELQLEGNASRNPRT